MKSELTLPSQKVINLYLVSRNIVVPEFRNSRNTIPGRTWNLVRLQWYIYIYIYIYFYSERGHTDVNFRWRPPQPIYRNCIQLRSMESCGLQDATYKHICIVDLELGLHRQLAFRPHPLSTLGAIHASPRKRLWWTKIVSLVAFRFMNFPVDQN